MKPEFIEQLIQSLNQDLPYLGRSTRQKLESSHLKKLQSRSIPASVLLLFGFSKKDETTRLLVTRRSHKVESHKGQMAFPGGVADPSDRHPIHTALRETEEEVGISSGQIDVYGVLPELTTLSSGFWILPVVGVLRDWIEDVALELNEDEIDATFWVSLPELLNPEAYGKESFRTGSVQIPTHVFQVAGERIWGATAAMIRNILDRLERIQRGNEESQ